MIPLLHPAISECMRDKGFIIMHYINSSVAFFRAAWNASAD